MNENDRIGAVYLLDSDQPESEAEKNFLPGDCRSEEKALTFETIGQGEQGDTGQLYEFYEPDLILVNHPEEIDRLRQWVTGEAGIQLQSLDYETDFALAVFQGWQGTSGYGVEIKCLLARQGGVVDVYVRFQRPDPDKLQNAVITSPYHLIKIQKRKLEGQEIIFNLIENRTVIDSFSF